MTGATFGEALILAEVIFGGGGGGGGGQRCPRAEPDGLFLLGELLDEVSWESTAEESE